jgi:surfeit locus 1 family protein
MTSKRLFIPTLLFVVMLAMLVALGTWQIQRLQWKTALLADVEQRLSAAPLEILSPDDLPAGRDLNFQRVQLQGQFVGPVVVVPSKVYNNVVGVYIHQLFALPSAQAVFMVNRGWVADDQLTSVLAQMQATPSSSLTDAAPLTISGLLRTPSAAGAFTPPNDLARRIFYRLNASDFATVAELPAQAVLPYVLELDTGLNGELPIKSGIFVPTLPNKHLGYALTWYGLAIVLSIIYGVYFRQARNSLRNG